MGIVARFCQVPSPPIPSLGSLVKVWHIGEAKAIELCERIDAVIVPDLTGPWSQVHRSIAIATAWYASDSTNETRTSSGGGGISRNHLVYVDE